MADDSEREYCGVGIRGMAMVADTSVWFVAFFVAVFAVGAVTGDVTTTANGADASVEGGAALAALGVWICLTGGYHTLTEWRYGKTLGKRLVKIEVERADGSSLDARSALVRNAVRYVDWLPAFYLLGMLTMSGSDRDQRLGDRVADTVVVRS
jgi:uncharacterized RDD family membrane protein YckC